ASASGWTTSAPTSFTFSAEGSKTAYAWAKDAAGNVSSSLTTTVTITLPDLTAPTMSAFSMPSTATTLSVAISSLTATDNRAVTGYLVTESSTKPAASASGWTTSAPTSFTFSATGTKIAYAWAKDAAGNVSSSLLASVSISLTDTKAPSVSRFSIPPTSSSKTISITRFTANDNVGVIGYLITETSTPPATNAIGWSNSKPTTYTAATSGSHTLYPWVKDAAGNVSAVFGSPKTVNISVTSASNAIDTIIAFNDAKDTYYTSLQQAYDDGLDGDTLLTKVISINENINTDLSKKIVVAGGYDDQFSVVSSYTNLQGKVTIGQGALVVDRMIID
ncbi:MAG: hypothetical protein HXX11_17845, partial [Desulfuromonadales bacterium]|nr:hypothetical protein [Desulfuromonadales bacterium]